MAIIKGFFIIFAIMILSCAHSTSVSEIEDPPAVHDSIPDSTAVRDSIPDTTTQIPPIIHDSLVYDFAPLDVGTKWEYSYYYQDAKFSGLSMASEDSLQIHIDLLSRQISGSDTFIFLSIKEDGMSIRPLQVDSPTYHYIEDTTTINYEYIDTVVVSDGSISRTPGYRCRIFPFWKQHGIKSDSLIKIVVGVDTMAAIHSSRFTYSTVYLRGTGLYSQYEFIGCCHMVPLASIKLRSFNDKPIQIDTTFNKYPPMN